MKVQHTNRMTNGNGLTVASPPYAKNLPFYCEVPNYPCPSGLAAVANIPLDMIDEADYNPKGRETQRTFALAASVREMGLACLPTVSPVWTGKAWRFRLTEGKRRHVVMGLLKRETMPCIIRTDCDSERMFAHVNAQTCRHNATQKLETYLAAPNAVNNRMRAALDNASARIGRKGLVWLLKHRGNIHHYHVAVQIAQRCGVDTNDFIKKALAWLLKHTQTHAAREWMKRTRQDANKLLRAVMTDKPLG